MAQLGRALRSGRRGRKFKSCHSDLKKPIKQGIAEVSVIPCFFAKGIGIFVFVLSLVSCNSTPLLDIRGSYGFYNIPLASFHILF